MASDYREFTKHLKKHGLKVEILQGAHMGIFRGSRRIYTMAATPKNAFEATQNTIRDLVLMKQLPNGTIYRGRIYKRKRTEKRLYDD